ncbi:MAG TPA: VCBS repeat-containing protein [Fimbriiglobus sp.]
MKAYDAESGNLNFEVKAFESAFTGGVRVATADINRDTYPDMIVAPGPGGGPRVRVLDGKTGEQIAGPLGNFFAYDAGFTGGVAVAGADVNGDGFPDVITAAGEGGGPHVKVFNGKDGTVLASFFAFEESFHGGVNVAAADFTGDGKAELVVGAGSTGAPRVRILNLNLAPTPRLGTQAAMTPQRVSANPQPIPGPLGDFFAALPVARGGATVGTDWKAGDVTGDGIPDLVVGSGVGSAPTVRVYSGADGSLVSAFPVFDSTMTAGVRVASAYITDDVYADVVVATGPGVPNRVQVYDGSSIIHSTTPQLIPGSLADFAPFGAGYNGGVSVGASNDPPTLLDTETSTITWANGQYITVVSEVYDLTDKFEWDYHVTNNNFNWNGYTPGVGMFWVTFDDLIPDVDDLSPTLGWDVAHNAPLGQDYSGVVWHGPEEGTHLNPTQTATFSFTTDPRPIGHIAATAADDGYSYLASGEVLGPKEKPSVSATFDTKYIPVNANNTNWNPNGTAPRWKSEAQKNIPFKRDFEATNLWQADPELIPVTVRVFGGYGGTLTAEATTALGDGQVVFWADNKKMAQFASTTITPGDYALGSKAITIYAEGKHESTYDILQNIIGETHAMFRFTLTDTPQVTAQKSVNDIVVTPILDDLSVVIPNPSVEFVDQANQDGRLGLRAAKTDGNLMYHGITFLASVTNGNMSIKYTQVITGLFNNANGSGAGAVYTDASKMNLLPTPKNPQTDTLTYPALDVQSAADPVSAGNFVLTPRVDPATGQQTGVYVRCSDFPSTGIPLNEPSLDRIDFRMEYRTYLVVQYGGDDGSLYTFGYVDWSVVFFAKTNVANKGVTVIDAKSKVAVDPNQLLRSGNPDPSKTVGPIYNFNVTWQ